MKKPAVSKRKPAISRAALVEGMLDAALRAGAAAAAIGERGCVSIAKDDGSPVTEADHAAEAIIREALQNLAPDVPVVSEECAASHALLPPSRFFLVDPIDGTKEFIAGNGEYTINIGLIEAGQPVLGVVFAPVLDELYWVDENGFAFLRKAGKVRPIAVRPPPAGMIALISRSHPHQPTMAMLKTYPVARRSKLGSSLKFCRIAAGKADIYIRAAGTSEWDTAAADAVLRAAGGRMLTLDGGVLRYGRKGFRNSGYIALGGS